METEKLALSDELLELLPANKRPTLFEEAGVVGKIKSYIFDFVEKYS
jgi:hypothetical protein